ncbi:hypothetical protein P7K49_021160, partial [Saguinus oedipus]
DKLCRPLGTEPKTGGKGSKSVGCNHDYSHQDPEGQAEGTGKGPRTHNLGNWKWERLDTEHQ